MLPVVQIGPLALRLPGLLLLLGAYLGLSLAERHSNKRGIPAAQLYNLTFIVMVCALLGARLSYFAQHSRVFSGSLLNLFSLDTHLLDPIGGAACGLLAALIYTQRKRLAFWSLLDAFTPALAVFALFTALANLASGQAFGSPTSLPWAIELWGARRHPSQVYEGLAALALLIVLWRQFSQDIRPGELFLRFLAGSAAIRLVLDAFRSPGLLLPGGIRLAQGLAWILLALVLLLLERRKRTD